MKKKLIGGRIFENLKKILIKKNLYELKIDDMTWAVARRQGESSGKKAVIPQQWELGLWHKLTRCCLILGHKLSKYCGEIMWISNHPTFF